MKRINMVVVKCVIKSKLGYTCIELNSYQIDVGFQLAALFSASACMSHSIVCSNKAERTILFRRCFFFLNHFESKSRIDLYCRKRSPTTEN